MSLLAHTLGPDDGQPWVLIHGLGATSLGWYPALQRLKGDCRLLVPELAVQGGTRSPHEGLNVREAVPALLDLVDRWRRGDPVVLAGISLGGWIAVRMALERPELARALLLIAAAGYRNQDWLRIQELLEVEDLDDVDRLIEALFRRPALPVRWGRRAFRRTYRSEAVRYVLESTSAEETYGPHELARLDLPVGLIWGAHDGIFPVEVGRAMERCLPDARLEVLAGCAHVVPWDCPRDFVRALDGFRTRLAAAR